MGNATALLSTTGRVLLFLFGLAAALPIPASATVVVYYNEADFLSSVGSAPVVIDFDSILTGTDLTGQTISGVTFNSPIVLEVVSGTLPPTTGSNILSPGGPLLLLGDPAFENDDLELTFSQPVRAVGLNIIFQSRDCCSYTSYAVGAPGGPAGEVTIPAPAQDGAAGAIFFGVVSDSYDISWLSFDETDADTVNPDGNIAYDSIRLVAVPEPTTTLMIASGLLILAVRRIGRRGA
jgi:hypothetical protein